MIYLALDTNIWLYLSNGFDPENQNYLKALHTYSHFGLLNALNEKIHAGEITVLINDIIISEWERNKENATNLIKEIRRHRQNLNENLKSLKPYLNEKTENFILNEVKREILNKSEHNIKRNQEHIQQVELFLKCHCLKIPVTMKNYADAAKMAIDKKAPFHNNKNNVADAVILLSVIDYLSRIKSNETNHVIFVSNNASEFADNPKSEAIQFHKDIIDILDGKSLTYKRHLGEAIELSEDLIYELDYYYQYKEQVENQRKFYCLIPDCGNDNAAFGFLDSPIKVFDQKNFYWNPGQLTLFEFTEEDRKILKGVRQTVKGNCLNCGTTHIICPNCGSMTCDPDGLRFYFCNECGSEYQIQYHPLIEEDCLSLKEREVFYFERSIIHDV